MATVEVLADVGKPEPETHTYDEPVSSWLVLDGGVLHLVDRQHSTLVSYPAGRWLNVRDVSALNEVSRPQVTSHSADY